MYVLGLTTLGDAAASLICDGQIVAAAVIVIANIVSILAMLTVVVNPVWHAATQKAPEPILDLGEEIPAA